MAAGLVRMNDGSSKSPRLEVHQALWGMIGLPKGGTPWPLEEQLERIAAAGFSGVLRRMPEPAEEDGLYRLLERYGLKLGVHSFPYRVEEMAPLARRAREFGVSYVNAQVADAFVIDQAAVELIRSLQDACAAESMPLFIETHRGRITQDLLRTVSYVNAIPDLRLTIDLSHYVVAGEVLVPSEAVEQAFAVLLKRTSCLHARVSNGQQVQVDIGNGEEGPAAHFLRWWSKGLGNWLEGAGPGDILPFAVELGPPPYGITFPNGAGGHAPEVSDRWQQALVMKRLAEHLWTESVKGATGG